jgi:hypothetical protein
MAWIPFEYRDFWEAPRLIVCAIDGVEYMLDSEFDETANAYAPIYKGYRLPAIPDPHAPAALEPRAEEERVLIGILPIGQLRFDATLRRELDDAPLRALIQARP